MSIVAVMRSISPRELEQGLADQDSLSRLLDSDETPEHAGSWCLLEKTQFAIHFLLTGDPSCTDSVLAKAIYGGEETGLVLPAGPVTYLTPTEVREVASELSKIPREELARRFSPQRLMEAVIYPGIWDQEAKVLDSLLDDYAALVGFYADASLAGNAVLIHIG